ncbi:MAG: peptide deformylase [Alphaproteobacteria bacterium]|nr:peptide deformylase [Alphaproteobacteria bacterium]
MAILKIAKMGHPVLMRPAEPVPNPTSPEIKRLVADMIETMDDADGRGLAATQVHVNKRVVVFRPPPEDPSRPDDRDGPVLALVNPEITPLGGEMEDGWEGCLSVPGLRGLVPRYAKVRYRGVTPAGEQVDRTVSGYHARVVQHEVDHLDGVLYPVRMKDLGLLMFESEFERFLDEGAAPRAQGRAE